MAPEAESGIITLEFPTSILSTMSFEATVFRVLVASPGDLLEERGIIADVIHDWNATHAGDARAVLLPVRWETHSVPEQGDRPQAILNRRIVADCDILIGAFWTRLGTPTGTFASGTLEEIAEFSKAGKPALLYFSSREIDPDRVDLDQLKQVREAKERFKSSGLVDQFSSPHEFREKLKRHLEAQVRRLISQNTGSRIREDEEQKYENVIITVTVPSRDAQRFSAAVGNSLPILSMSYAEHEDLEYTDLYVRFRVPIAASIVSAVVRNAAERFGAHVISLEETTPPPNASRSTHWGTIPPIMQSKPQGREERTVVLRDLGDADASVVAGDGDREAIPTPHPVQTGPNTADVKVVSAVSFQEYVVRELETGSIEVLRDGVLIVPVKPALRELAKRLDIALFSRSGNLLTTRQLGRQVIKSIRELGVPKA